MKTLKIFVPFLLAGFFTTASATTSIAEPLQPKAGAVLTQTSFSGALPPLALAVVNGAENRRMSEATATQQQSASTPFEEDDFTLGLAGALMMGMVVIKRFSR